METLTQSLNRLPNSSGILLRGPWIFTLHFLATDGQTDGLNDWQTILKRSSFFHSLQTYYFFFSREELSTAVNDFQKEDFSERALIYPHFNLTLRLSTKAFHSAFKCGRSQQLYALVPLDVLSRAFSCFNGRPSTVAAKWDDIMYTFTFPT